ncbi:farnesol dehydrogenase-like [Atheta coriaria]|uniref:farnesol dehydrogenase-like n=1 Tax=Dalotia coriaria TaxID=877792 RepID=UPI0031F415D3
MVVYSMLKFTVDETLGYKYGSKTRCFVIVRSAEQLVTIQIILYRSLKNTIIMDRWFGKTAIVTGASSGIGEVIAEYLVKEGMQVVGLSRRVERIQANAVKLADSKGKLYAFKCDIRNEEEVCKAFEWTTANVGIVHVLVNNAGISRPTNLIAGDAEMWRTVLETNVLGLCVAQREACKLMMANDIAGHIVNINSIAGQSHLYYASTNVYGASKHALTNICEMLRSELTTNKSKIKVTSVSPGLVRTEINELYSFPDEVEAMKDMPMLEPKDVAEAVLYTLGTSPSIMVNEITLRPVGSAF